MLGLKITDYLKLHAKSYSEAPLVVNDHVEKQ